jgi:Uma2 family endonuclease
VAIGKGIIFAGKAEYVCVQDWPMITKTAKTQTVPPKAARPLAKRNGGAAGAKRSSPKPAPAPLPDLPTFPIEVGYREVYEPATKTVRQLPLTLLEVLFPTEEDIGVVKMAQSPLHDLWVRLLTAMLQTYLAAADWLILHDVLIHWGRKGAPPKSPDIAVIPNGRLPDETEQSYRVGRDGPPPLFLVEITSKETRKVDLETKPVLYAAFGVREMLVIDIRTRSPAPWRLIGYRLTDSPFYRPIQPDEDGGLTFETVGLRFVAIGRERVDVFDIETGERLLTPNELSARAELESEARAAAEARAELESEARAAAEHEADALRARIRELEQQLGKSDEPA